MEFVTEALSQSTSTYVIISMLCGIAILSAMDYFGNQTMGFVLLPFAIGSALCISHYFASIHLYSVRNLSEWLLFTIFAATAGLTFTLGLYVAISRFVGRVGAGSGRSQVEWRVRHIRLDPRE